MISHPHLTPEITSLFRPNPICPFRVPVRNVRITDIRTRHVEQLERATRGDKGWDVWIAGLMEGRPLGLDVVMRETKVPSNEVWYGGKVGDRLPPTVSRNTSVSA